MFQCKGQICNNRTRILLAWIVLNWPPLKKFNFTIWHIFNFHVCWWCQTPGHGIEQVRESLVLGLSYIGSLPLSGHTHNNPSLPELQNILRYSCPNKIALLLKVWQLLQKRLCNIGITIMGACKCCLRKKTNAICKYKFTYYFSTLLTMIFICLCHIFLLAVFFLLICHCDNI